MHVIFILLYGLYVIATAIFIITVFNLGSLVAPENNFSSVGSGIPEPSDISFVVSPLDCFISFNFTSHSKIPLPFEFILPRCF